MLELLKKVPKKTIGGLTGAVTVYLYVTNIIGENEVVLIVGIMASLGIAVEGATSALEAKKASSNSDGK